MALPRRLHSSLFTGLPLPALHSSPFLNHTNTTFPESSIPIGANNPYFNPGLFYPPMLSTTCFRSKMFTPVAPNEVLIRQNSNDDEVSSSEEVAQFSTGKYLNQC